MAPAPAWGGGGQILKSERDVERTCSLDFSKP